MESGGTFGEIGGAEKGGRMMGPTRATILYMIVQAGKAALEQLADEQLMATATPEQVAELKRMVRSGENAEKALRRIESHETFE